MSASLDYEIKPSASNQSRGPRLGGLAPPLR
jgi:hypothetical protein